MILYGIFVIFVLVNDLSAARHQHIQICPRLWGQVSRHANSFHHAKSFPEISWTILANLAGSVNRNTKS